MYKVIELPVVLFFIMLLLVAFGGFMCGLIGNDLAGESAISEPESALVDVEIIELCRNGEGTQWTLLKTSCGQRCYIYTYRGQEGDKFKMHPDDIGGYQPPFTDGQEELIEPPFIELDKNTD